MSNVMHCFIKLFSTICQPNLVNHDRSLQRYINESSILFGKITNYHYTRDLRFNLIKSRNKDNYYYNEIRRIKYLCSSCNSQTLISTNFKDNK